MYTALYDALQNLISRAIHVFTDTYTSPSNSHVTAITIVPMLVYESIEGQTINPAGSEVVNLYSMIPSRKSD